MKRNSLFLLIFTFLFIVFFFPEKAFAEVKNVLLVYDSLNIANDKENDVDSLQRLLTSYGVAVKTVSDSDYLSEELLNDNFDAVITMVNWSEKGISNPFFLADRAVFTGQKLHIGGNLAADEQQLFSSSFKTLSHRQYTLKDEKNQFSEILDYKDQSTILEQTSGSAVGYLETQERNSVTYPFGVIEGEHAFLPFFSKKGAVFLKSAELLGKWLGKTKAIKPILAINKFNPMKDMDIAEDFQKQLANLNTSYIFSSTSVNVNNTLPPYQIFTDVLRSFQGDGIFFLEVPIVNNVNLNDNHVLSQIIEQQVSLLVERDVYPTGIATPGYWNQDEQYQTDGLSFSNTVILQENPALEQVFYRSQTNSSNVFNVAFYDISYDYLSNVQWNGNQKINYFFPMPVTISFAFPDTKKESKDIIKKMKDSRLSFYTSGSASFSLELQTTTQHIQFINRRLYLNDKLVNGLNELQNTEVTEAKFQGLFARFFNITDGVLVGIVLVTLAILTILFILGRRNYREKYINQKGEK